MIRVANVELTEAQVEEAYAALQAQKARPQWAHGDISVVDNQWYYLWVNPKHVAEAAQGREGCVCIALTTRPPLVTALTLSGERLCPRARIRVEE